MRRDRADGYINRLKWVLIWDQNGSFSLFAVWLGADLLFFTQALGLLSLRGAEVTNTNL